MDCMGLRGIYVEWIHVELRYMLRKKKYGFHVDVASTYDDAQAVLC